MLHDLVNEQHAPSVATCYREPSLSFLVGCTGPVSGLQEQYNNFTPDTLNISVSTPNWFLHSGSGNDALAVSSGTNVLGGGTCSNFLTGGSGTDTFLWMIADPRPTSGARSIISYGRRGNDMGRNCE
jgi:Ca2+-binding RTX toxin-like protein